ncbi:MAG: polymerase subunit delta [Candidatus Saccharibacteria bacterium]|nr:polymerase subunit delta [Candidatus Saccharibacteria bacterium]
MALERLDGEEASFERMQEALQSLPFLADKKMVVLTSPSANKQFAEKAEKLLQELPETTDLIIVEPKLDKRSAYYKFLKKQKGYQEFGELDERGLSRWLIDQAKEKGSALSGADASYLVSRVGTNQQTLANEIEKLSLYADKIDRRAIEALSPQTPQSTIFQLLETAFAGNTKRALEMYGEQRALKVEPQQIIAMLAWQLHVLALIKTAKDKTPDEIARDAKMSPYVVRKSTGIARSLTLAQTKRLIIDLLEIDERLKREALNADDTLLNYLMTISE